MLTEQADVLRRCPKWAFIYDRFYDWIFDREPFRALHYWSIQWNCSLPIPCHSAFNPVFRYQIPEIIPNRFNGRRLCFSARNYGHPFRNMIAKMYWRWPKVEFEVKYLRNWSQWNRKRQPHEFTPSPKWKFILPHAALVSSSPKMTTRKLVTFSAIYCWIFSFIIARYFFPMALQIHRKLLSSRLSLRPPIPWRMIETNSTGLNSHLIGHWPSAISGCVSRTD